jgi:molecular chaperone GrpE
MDKKKKEEVRESVENKEQPQEDYKAKYLRALADYQNYERRVFEQRTELIKNANKELILKLITFLDDLDRAEQFVSDKNLAHIKDSFYKMLSSEGLEEIDVLNKEFDPYTSEVVDMVAGEKDNIVVEVLRKGYMLNGSVVRVAQVRVSKKG